MFVERFRIGHSLAFFFFSFSCVVFGVVVMSMSNFEPGFACLL